MAAIIEINTGTLKTDIDGFNGELKAIRQEIANLRDVAAALGSTWDGDAKNAFMTELSEDIGKLERLVSEMEKYTVKTDDARAAYDSCENTVAQIIAGMKV